MSTKLHLPWHVEAGSSNPSDGAFYIKDSRGRTIVRLDTESSLTDEERAAFIVRAVNSHADLLSALEEIRDHLYNTQDLARCRDLATAAIQKAQS